MKKENEIAEMARDIVVLSDSDRARAVIMLKEIDAVALKLEEKYHLTENKKQAYSAYKKAMDTYNQIYKPIEAAIKKIKDAIKGYDLECALLEQAKKQAEAMDDNPMQGIIDYETLDASSKPKKLVVKARVTDVKKVCALIAEGTLPDSLVEIKQSELNVWAKAQDINTTVAGLELYQDIVARV